jgi:hypothetical protein
MLRVSKAVVVVAAVVAESGRHRHCNIYNQSTQPCSLCPTSSVATLKDGRVF